MDLENDSHVNELIINRELSQKTAWIYYHNIGLYCDLIGLTPEQLIDEAINEFNIHPSKRKIRKHLIKWKDWLLQQPYEQNTRKKMFDHVRYFYQEFEIELPKKIKMKSGQDRQLSIEDLPSVDELRFVLNSTNLRTQAIILLMCSSGLSKIDIRHIKYKDFLKAIQDYYKPAKHDQLDIDELTENLKDTDVVGTWQGHRLKNRENPIKYITFNTPEATRAILTYLKTDPPKTLNSYLFRFNHKQITEEAFNKYFNYLNRRCGFGKVGKESYIASHNFRRRFATLLAENKVDFIRAEFMMGHLLPQTKRSYYKILTVETMKSTYLEVLPALCIVEDVETIVLTDDRVKELENENKFILDILKREGLYETDVEKHKKG